MSEEIEYLQRFGGSKVPKTAAKMLRGQFLENYCFATFEDLWNKGDGTIGVIATEDKNVSDNLWVFFKDWVTKYTSGAVKVIEAIDMPDEFQQQAKAERWHFFRLVKLDNLT